MGSRVIENRLVELMAAVDMMGIDDLTHRQSFYVMMGNRMSGDDISKSILSKINEQYPDVDPGCKMKYSHIFTHVPAEDRVGVLKIIYDNTSEDTILKYAGKEITRKDVVDRVDDKELLKYTITTKDDSSCETTPQQTVSYTNESDKVIEEVSEENNIDIEDYLNQVHQDYTDAETKVENEKPIVHGYDMIPEKPLTFWQKIKRFFGLKY